MYKKIKHERSRQPQNEYTAMQRTMPEDSIHDAAGMASELKDERAAASSRRFARLNTYSPNHSESMSNCRIRSNSRGTGLFKEVNDAQRSTLELG